MREATGTKSSSRRAPSLALLLGGFDRPTRADDIAAGRRPSNDVQTLVDTYDAAVFDFTWMEAPDAPRSRRLLATLARRTGQWSAALALATAFEVRRHEVVYISGEDIGVVAGAVSRLIPRRAPWFVLRVERPVYGRTRVRRFVHRRAMSFATRRMSVAVCRTTAIARHMDEHTNLAPGRSVAFGQEIDTRFFAPDAAAATDVAPLPAVDGPYVLSAGLERRDYSTLLNAVDGLPVTLVVAAGSPWSKDTFQSDRELPTNVIVGTFDHPQMRELYRGASAVVLSVFPTERACGMNVVGEAWAMARPVIASATIGLADFITSDDNGLLVPPGDVSAMRQAICDVLHDPDRAARLAGAGRAYVEAELSLERFAQTIDAAVEQRSR